MEALMGIIVFFLLVLALIKGWIWLVNSIMNPKIKAAEEKRLKAIENNPKYQFWTKAEELINEIDNKLKEISANSAIEEKQEDVKEKNSKEKNVYVAKHFRIIEGNKKAEELRASFKRGHQQLVNQYQDYLKWCQKNNTKPLIPDPDEDGWPEVYSIN